MRDACLGVSCVSFCLVSFCGFLQANTDETDDTVYAENTEIQIEGIISRMQLISIIQIRQEIPCMQIFYEF